MPPHTVTNEGDDFGHRRFKSVDFADYSNFKPGAVRGLPRFSDCPAVGTHPRSNTYILYQIRAERNRNPPRRKMKKVSSESRNFPRPVLYWKKDNNGTGEKLYMNKTSQVLLTEGSIPKKMLLFALPIFLSNLFQQLYNAADSLIVGNFIGKTALAAVGSSGNLIFLLVGFANGVAMGAGVLIAHCFGAKDDLSLERAVHTTVAVGLAGSAILTVLGVTLTPLILRWMGTPADVLGSSIAYFRIYTAGITSVILYNMGAAILQSVGDSRSPMRYLIIASLLNVALDLLFVAGMGCGVASAALATILSQTVSAVLVFRKLMSCRQPYQVRVRRIRFEKKTFGKVMALGIPSGVQNSIIAFANVVVQSKINAFGASAMAGCGAYSKVEGFAFLPITCFAMALATFVSQNIGAGEYGRVRAGTRFGILCSTLLAEGIGVAMFALAPWLIGFFSSNPTVIRYGIGDARTVALFYFLLAFSHCCAGILRGMGRPVVPMTVMLFIWCGLRLAYITSALHFFSSIRVIWWAYPLTWAVSGVIFTVYLLHTRIPGEQLPDAA